MVRQDSPVSLLAFHGLHYAKELPPGKGHLPEGAWRIGTGGRWPAGPPPSLYPPLPSGGPRFLPLVAAASASMPAVSTQG